MSEEPPTSKYKSKLIRRSRKYSNTPDNLNSSCVFSKTLIFRNALLRWNQSSPAARSFHPCASLEQTGQGQCCTSSLHSHPQAAFLPQDPSLTRLQALLVIDHQVGLAQVVRDYNTNDFRNNILGHAALGNVFNLPTVLTTSSDAGPNGLMLKEIMDVHPNATLIRRQGEVNAWDNADFRAAVKATGKKQLIIAGIVTEVCK